MSEHKQEESFRVIDRRPFTAEGELRKEVVEDEERQAQREAALHPPAPAPVESSAKLVPSADAPKPSLPFENLVRMLGSNAAMVLGAYADPRTGQPVDHVISSTVVAADSSSLVPRRCPATLITSSIRPRIRK